MQDRRIERQALTVLNRVWPSVVLAIVCSWAAAAAFADWPRWRGLDGDGILEEKQILLEQWPRARI